MVTCCLQPWNRLVQDLEVEVWRPFFYVLFVLWKLGCHQHILNCCLGLQCTDVHDNFNVLPFSFLLMGVFCCSLSSENRLGFLDRRFWKYRALWPRELPTLSELRPKYGSIVRYLSKTDAGWCNLILFFCSSHFRFWAISNQETGIACHPPYPVSTRWDQNWSRSELRSKIHLWWQEGQTQ